jgi:hypothetical protein
MKQEVNGQDLIQLLINALEEGRALEATEVINRLLAQKMSESLAHKRQALAEAVFGIGEGVEELVKTSNEPENREDPEEEADETGGLLHNNDLTQSPSDQAEADFEEQHDEINETEAGRKRREAAFQKTQKDKTWPMRSSSKTRQIVRSVDRGVTKAKQGAPRHGSELPRKKVTTPGEDPKYLRRGGQKERDEIAKRLRARLQKRRGKTNEEIAETVEISRGREPQATMPREPQKKSFPRTLDPGKEVSPGVLEVDVVFHGKDAPQKARDFLKAALVKLDRGMSYAVPGFARPNMQKVVARVKAKNGREAQTKVQKLLSSLR